MKYIFICILFCCNWFNLVGQTIIFTDPGKSYNNIDMTVTDNYPVSVSNCTSLRFTMNFEFSEPWPGSGNMEEPSECISGCGADPENPTAGGCNFCWDFMFVELLLDGVVVESELIGVFFETRQSGTISWIVCTNGAANANIRIRNQNWAADETNTFSNLILECWDATPTAVATPTPLCAGDDLNLDGTIAVPADAMSWLWTVSGTGTIVSPPSLMTTATNAANGDIYTLTTTDDNNCTASSEVTVVVNPVQDPSFSHADFCGSVSGPGFNIITPGGTFDFDFVYPFPLMINPVTGVILNADPGTTYPVLYVTPGPCPSSSVVNITSLEGPSGTLTGSASLCPDECTTFTFDFTSGSEPFTINLTASGFPLPPIPGVSASQQFTICYTGAGPLPTFDLGTFTINIPTIFTGSGSLTLTGISDASGCPGTASGGFNLTLTSGPTALPAGPLTACADSNGDGTFDLTTLDDVVNGSIGTLIVSWYEDIDALIPISNPTAYVSAGGTVYATVTEGNCVSATVPVVLIVNTATVPFINMVCADSGTDNCGLCVTGGFVELAFSFGDGDTYLVTVRDDATFAEYSGTVSNSVTLSVPITNSTVFELLNIQPLTGCPNLTIYGDLVTINIVNAPEIDPVVILPSCQPITLPGITGNNLSGNQSYFTGPNGTGTMYNVGDMIFASQTLYVFDMNAGCEDEVTFDVTINPLIMIDPIADIFDCVSTVLPAIAGSGLSANVTYNTDPLGLGTNFAPGSIITQSITLYVFDPDADPNCLGNSEDLIITIHPLPPVPTISNVTCIGDQGAILVEAPLGSNFEYQLDGAAAQLANFYANIPNGTHTVVVTNTITTCQNSVQFTVNCDCATPAELTLHQNTGSVCVGDSAFINNVTFGGATNLVNVTSNGTGSFSATTFTTSPFNIIYIPSSDDAGKTITITLTTNDPDGTGSCAPETINYSLTVRNNPLGSITGNQLVCVGQDVTLVASGGLTYNWSDGGGMSNSATFNDITQKDTFSVYIIDAFGCKDTVSYEVNVGQISAGRDTLLGYCKTVTTIINLNTLISTGATTGGIWKNGTDTIQNFANFTITDLPLGFTTLRYIVDDPICGRDTAIVRVDIRNSNNAGMDASDEFCEGLDYRTSLEGLIGSFDGNGTWLITPFTNRITINLPDIEVNDPPVGRYLVQYIVPFNGCNADTSTITIDILATPDAGKDTSITTCIGVDIDLFSLIRSNDLTGTIRNPNNFPGLNGNVWNTAGRTSGIYTFEYFIPSVNFFCPDDEASITINLQTALSAGTAQIGRFCDGETINLNEYLSANADPGGTFYFQNQVIPNGIVTPTGAAIDYVYTYEVGDDIFCPKSTAFITLRKTLAPNFQFGNMVDICDNDCFTLTNTHNASIGSFFYYTIKNGSGSFIENETVEVLMQNNTINLPFCTNGSLPTSFYNLDVGETFTLRLDSIVTPDGCVFDIDDEVTFNTLRLNERVISPQICKEEIYTIGTEEFSFTRPTGSFTKPTIGGMACDTIITVNLRFYPDAIGTFEATYCDESKTVQIGNDIFDFARPTGTATLIGGSIYGCDSLVQVNLKWEKTVISGSFTYSTCQDDYSYSLGGQIFNKANPSGPVLLPGVAASGCDSLVNVQLNFSEFAITQTLDYKCDGSDPQLLLNLASHPGPYSIFIDGNPVGQSFNLPFSTTIGQGSHSVVVTNPDGCSQSFNIDVEDSKGPEVSLSQTPNADGTVQITTTAPPNVLYDLVWTPSNTLSCNDCLNPIANPATTTTYLLNYLYGNQCTDQRQITIERLNTLITLPNIFSPNGDGKNDAFFVQFPNKVTGTVKSMSIYDRWGNLVFLAKDKPGNSPADGWNGSFGSQEAMLGVYVYLIEVQIDGKAGIDTYTGSVTLVK
jgi:gliding motility-associated-like protein